MATAEALIALCTSDALVEAGAGLRFTVEAEREAVGAFVVRFHGRVFAYLNRCAHVAMELDWLPGQFFDSEHEVLLCATHGAVYDPTSGACAGGPCVGRGGLRRLQVIESDGVVYWRPEGAMRLLEVTRSAV